MAEPTPGNAENRCFGCSPDNPRGLRLRFESGDDGEVWTEYAAPEELCGAPGVVHGGIQAALLDEVLGHAAHVGSQEDDFDLVTVDFRLRYRRPAPTGTPLRIRGRLLRAEDRDYYVEGEIVDATGEVLTRAEARWRRIPPRP